MPASDSHQEWQRLNDLYSEERGEELLELRLAYADLTEAAQSVLRDELRRRKLWDSHEPPGTAAEDSSPPTDSDDNRIWDDLRGVASLCANARLHGKQSCAA